MRKKSVELFLDAMKDCSFLIPQKVPDGYDNSYYTLGVLYEGQEKIGVSWKDFWREYIKNGGDGFYGACMVNYLEPVMAERKFVKRCPWVYEDVKYEQGLCPVAERVQKKLMQFKTNYRDVELASAKADALRKTIQKLSS
jgi:perosamine synthetase